MKIRKLHIEKYKVFDEAIFDFVDKEGKTLDTIVLAGVNGCGKTSVLEYIKTMLNGHYKDIKKTITVKGNVEITEAERNNIKGNIVFQGYPNLAQKIANIQASSNNKFLVTVGVPPFLNNNPLPALDGGKFIYFEPSTYKIEPELSNNVILLDIHNAENMEESMLKSVRDEIFKNKEISPKQTIENAVQKVNFLLSDFKLNTRLVDFESERMIFESLNGEKIYFDDLSNGEKQLYFRAISLYQLNINEGIILVDEPEDSMHPTWQKAIISLYQKIGTNNQVIVATHSPHVMASVKPESLFLLHIDEKENGRKVQVLNMAKEGKHSKGLEPNRILKEIMEVEMLRDFETQQAIDELTKLLNIQDFEKEETTNLIAQLTTDLGRQDPFILKVNHQILMLNRQKEKLNHATY